MRLPRKLLIASILWAAGALTPAADKPLRLGPYVVGMSFEEARAAMPNLAWRTSLVSKYTGKVVSIVAPDAITLGGLSHAVELRPGYYAAYVMTFKHFESVASPADCERLGMAVLTDLENRLGPFVPPPASTQNESVKAGKQSTMTFTTDEDARKVPRTGNPHWRLGSAERGDADTRIRTEAMFDRDEYSTPFCKLATQIDHHPPAPPFEALKFAPSLLVKQPSIAIKHMSLGAVKLPAATVEVELACGVDRHTGVLDCAPKPGVKVSDEVRDAAIRRTLAMRVDTRGLDPDNPLTVVMDLKVVLSQSERHAIDFLAAPRVRLSDFVWTEQPSVKELEAAYPRSLLEEGVSAKVSVTCQVQPDLSLLCATTDPEPTGDAKAIEAHRKLAWASGAVMSLYQAAPTLKSGAPSAGVVVDTKVDFRPID